MPRNDRILRALSGEPTETRPVWLMRQAGRYLPEYRALREKAGNFWTLCKTPSLAAEAAMQPIVRYDLDAAILFSDILVIPEAMGRVVDFVDGEGPVFQDPLRRASDIEALEPVDLRRLNYLVDAVVETKTRLADSVPLIGFAGSPLTLACYMIEGRASRDFLAIRRLIAARPHLAHHLLDKLTRSIIDALLAQIAAGVDIVMLFDTWGALFDPAVQSRFSQPYLSRIVEAIRSKNRPIMIYAKGGIDRCLSLADLNFDAIGVDWTVDMAALRSRLEGRSIALQGNLDPALLACDREAIESATIHLLDSIEPTRHIVNLGHGVPKDTPPEGISRFIEAIRNHRIAPS